MKTFIVHNIHSLVHIYKKLQVKNLFVKKNIVWRKFFVHDSNRFIFLLIY